MSPRAAWRLESLGFNDVYHYAPGVADWAAAGLPVEGRAAKLATAGEAARQRTAPDPEPGGIRRAGDNSTWSRER